MLDRIYSVIRDVNRATTYALHTSILQDDTTIFIVPINVDDCLRGMI